MSLAILLLSYPVYTQESMFSFGANATPNITWHRGNDAFNVGEIRFSISPGVGVHYQFTSNVEFISGLYLDRKGGISHLTLTDESGEIIGEADNDFYIDYLTWPLMASYVSDGQVKVYLKGGTFLGFRLNQTYEIEAIGEEPARTEDHSKDFKNVDAGVVFGAGV